MAPHSRTFAWKIPWTEEPGRLQSMGLLESDTTEWLHFHFSLSCTGEGNGNQLQCSCLENPRDGGAWWAAVYGVAQSRTRLKRLSSSSSSMYVYVNPNLPIYPSLLSPLVAISSNAFLTELGFCCLFFVFFLFFFFFFGSSCHGARALGLMGSVVAAPWQVQ